MFRFNGWNHIFSISLLIIMAYLAILWTAVYVDGNNGLWRFLDMTSYSINAIMVQTERFSKYADKRATDDIVPTLLQELKSLGMLCIEGLKYAGIVLKEVTMVILYLISTIIDRLHSLLSHLLDTASGLIRYALLCALHILEPKVSPNLSFLFWAFLLARLLDRVIDNREDLEFMIGLMGKILQDTLMTVITGLERLSSFAIRLAIAYGIIFTVRRLQSPLMSVFETSNTTIITPNNDKCGY